MCFRLVAVLVWLGLLAASAQAQQQDEFNMLPSPTHLKSSIQFEHLSIENGLSQSSVYDIMQDRRGFMWFATQDGLNRYDGHVFQVYKRTPFDSASFHRSWIWSEEALDVLSDRGRADLVLVLSDINMPGMNGLELLRRIKSTPPPIPVCMMTAYGSHDYRNRASEYGSEGYLTKPVDFDELKARIRTLSASA